MVLKEIYSKLIEDPALDPLPPPPPGFFPPPCRPPPTCNMSCMRAQHDNAVMLMQFAADKG